MSRSDRTVVVTGANSGIGLATTLELAAGGFRVIGTVRSEAKAADLAGAAAQRGLEVETERCDVADAEETTEAFRRIAERTDGGPWAVVNNAGYAQPGAIEDVTDEQARALLEVQTIAPMRIARLVLPAMRARGDGRIVTVSSIAGRVSFPMLGWYAASKHAIEALSDALRVEVAPQGVKVVVVEPGSFGSGIWSDGAARLPDPGPQSPYAAVYRRRRAAVEATRRLPDPVWVARVIRLALTVPAPLPRYVVGFDALGAIAAHRLLPTAATDLAKGLGVGLRRLPGR